MASKLEATAPTPQVFTAAIRPPLSQGTLAFAHERAPPATQRGPGAAGGA
jgi:hypothetical protein